MSGPAAYDDAITDESFESTVADVSKPDPYTRQARESASNARQRLADFFQPGDTKTTTRRLSDTSTSEHDQFKRPGRRATKEEKSMLDSAHETVAKALGEGSRGKMIAASNVYSSELMGHLGAVQEVAD
ncbi:hypothetical protein POX_f07473 [Penicillium oxalicum]|uniref:hypothetical protein n=1 Tax=Penicillium oxalicum TaxID=69781 RepID=UPI0020B76387|nr:hypothetical protein POX_f07473 [Penicillium oxalicum]KAI2787113.1 hypothetical protein POX_f07473 [Penicillium oxalicum]